jgi:hypothetical protein
MSAREKIIMWVYLLTFSSSFLLELKKRKFRILITLTPVVGVAAATTPHQSTQISGTATFLNR